MVIHVLGLCFLAQLASSSPPEGAGAKSETVGDVAIVRAAVGTDADPLTVLRGLRAVSANRSGAFEVEVLGFGRFVGGSGAQFQLAVGGVELVRGRHWLSVEAPGALRTPGHEVRVSSGTSAVVDIRPSGTVIAVRHGTMVVDDIPIGAGQLLDLDGEVRSGGFGLLEAAAEERRVRLGMDSPFSSLGQLRAHRWRRPSAPRDIGLRWTGDAELFGSEDAEAHLLERALQPPPIPRERSPE
ncbi:MAG: hypothetical protein ACFB9M_17090 [Myxococcota bacterium]